MADESNPLLHDNRLVVWVAVKANGCPEMGTAKSPDGVPDRAVLWTRVGDVEWVRVVPTA